MGRIVRRGRTGGGALRLLAAAACLASAALASAGCLPADKGASSPEFRLSQAATRPAIVPAPVEEVTSAAAPHVPMKATPVPGGASDSGFDAAVAIREASAIAALGPRPAGSAAEARAAEHIARRLREIGLEPQVVTFSLPNGKTSRNVIATVPGTSSGRSVILGGHMDTKSPSPGANDNASGCGIMLELAAVLKDAPVAPDVRFVFFGSEEVLAGMSSDTHHLGSRHDARSLTANQRSDTAAMLSIDMVGRGDRFLVRNMRRGPQDVADDLLDLARRQGAGLSFERDPGKSGWSDHEAYERLGIPVAWLEWQSDSMYHTAGDVASRLQKRPIAATGRLVLDFLRGLDDRALEGYCDR